MISRVSPIYEKSYVGKWIFQVMGMEMEEARIIVESLRDQCYLERCTWGMRYWEERYGIEVDESKDLDARRAAVMIKRGNGRFITPASLEKILETLTGRKVNVNEDNAQYRFKISIEDGDSVVDYIAVIQKVNTVKPSHLAYSIELPRKGTFSMYFANAIHEVKRVAMKYDSRDILDVTRLAEELGNSLINENLNVFIDKERRQT